MAITVAVLEERVNGHIKFIWTLMAVGFTWLIGISIFLFNMNGTMNRVERAQVDAPARIVAGLLKRTPPTKGEMTDSLGAVSTILRTANFGKVKPSQTVLKDLAIEIHNAQEKYPDLSAVWQTTGQFINYKSIALLPASAERNLASARGLDCRKGRITTLHGTAIAENCTLDLENAIAADSVVFVNCLIRFRGGTIPIHHLEFKNCIFQCDITAFPSKEATAAMIQITTSTSEDFRVTLS